MIELGLGLTGLVLASGLGIGWWREAAQRRALGGALATCQQLGEELAQRAAALEPLRASLAAAERARDEASHRAGREARRALDLEGVLAASEEDGRRLQQQVDALSLVETARREAERALEEARAEVARLQEEAARWRASAQAPENSRRLVGRLQELDRLRDEAARERDEALRRAERAEGELARRDQSEGSSGLQEERDRLAAQNAQLEDTLRRSARLRAALQVLGVPLTHREGPWFAPDRRAGTVAIVREAYLSAAGTAAVLLDPEGWSWATIGAAVAGQRLASSAMVLEQADAGPALGRPVQLVSETFGVYGRHLALLPGPLRVLGVVASRECPALALRLARLQLVGPFQQEAAVSPAPEHVGALDPELSRWLQGWAERRRASAVSRFQGGHAAASSLAFAGATARLVPVVQRLAARGARDGFAEGFSVTWRAADDSTLVARRGAAGEVVFARFDAPVPARVLDELLASLRWATAGAARAVAEVA